MGRKIALVLTGAVSLGSFEAGVVAELLHALAWQDAQAPGQLTLDVLAGASAGSINSALMARALFDDVGRGRRLHDAWVDDADIRKLLAHDDGRSLLSRRQLDLLGEKHLGDDFSGARPARFAPPELRMSFTLANMNGVDYPVPAQRAHGRALVRTVFRDRIEFTLTPASGADVWRGIRAAAAASACLPLAFTPSMLERQPADFPEHCLGQFPPKFCYVDGGLFDNQPIGHAIDLARKLDGDTPETDRLFLLVAPCLNRSWFDSKVDDGQPLLELARRLGIMMWLEGGAVDWERAQRTNAELEWRDRLTADLIELLRSRPAAEVAEVAGRLTATAEKIASDKRQAEPGRHGDDYLPRALESTRRRFAPQLAGLTEADRELGARLIFLVNSITDLHRKARVDLQVLSVDGDQLAGEQALSFGGFFEQSWREHDYRVGRKLAHAELPAILGVAPYPRERGCEHEYDMPAAWSALPQARLRDAQRAPRELLRERLAAQASRAARSHAPGPRWLQFATRPLAGWAAGWVARQKLDQVLELD